MNKLRMLVQEFIKAKGQTNKALADGQVVGDYETSG